jgi:hypothetical protein
MTVCSAPFVPLSCRADRAGSGTISTRHNESQAIPGFSSFLPVVPEIWAGAKKPAQMLGRYRAYRAYYYVVVEVRHECSRTFSPLGQQRLPTSKSAFVEVPLTQTRSCIVADDGSEGDGASVAGAVLTMRLLGHRTGYRAVFSAAGIDISPLADSQRCNRSGQSLLVTSIERIATDNRVTCP